MYKYFPLLILAFACSSGTEPKVKEGDNNKSIRASEIVNETNYCTPSELEPGDTLKEEISFVKVNEYGEVFDLHYSLPPISIKKLLQELRSCYPAEEILSSNKQVIIRFMKGQRVVEKSYYLTGVACEYRCRFLSHR